MSAQMHYGWMDQPTTLRAGQGGGTHLYSVVGLREHVPGAHAAVDAGQHHVEAEGEEVAVVEMAHTVVQPRCGHGGVKEKHQVHKEKEITSESELLLLDLEDTIGHGSSVNIYSQLNMRR